MQAIANVSDDKGMARGYVQTDAAHDLGCSLITIKRCYAALIRPQPGAPGPFLRKLTGRRIEIIGVVEHDPARCDSDECHAEVEARRNVGGGRLSEKKRQQAAARARAYRERRRQAAQQ